MEYLIGCVITLITMSITAMFVRKNNLKQSKLLFSQSRGYSITHQYFTKKYSKTTKRQSVKNLYKKSVKTIYIGETAYWIENNALYEAEHINGHILKETQKRVDIMSMDKVELKRMIFIVDRLTEGLDNDSSNSGN